MVNASAGEKPQRDPWPCWCLSRGLLGARPSLDRGLALGSSPSAATGRDSLGTQALLCPLLPSPATGREKTDPESAQLSTPEPFVPEQWLTMALCEPQSQLLSQ